MGYRLYPQQPTSLSLEGAYPDMPNNPWNLGMDYGSLGSNSPDSAFYQPMVPQTEAQSTGMAGNGAAGTGAAIGAGLGLLSAIGQNNAYQAKMRALATTQRFSPWTHMAGTQPTAPNDLGNIVGLGASGAALGQGLGGGSLLPMALMGG